MKPSKLIIISFAFLIFSLSLSFVSAINENTTIKWKTQTAAGNGNWTSITWSPELGKFVAVSHQQAFPIPSTSRAMTSTNAINWNLSTGVTGGNPWSSITWSPELNLFVAVACGIEQTTTCAGVGQIDRVVTSPSGNSSTWTKRNASSAGRWQSIVWSPELSLFVAVADFPGGGINQIMTSPDAINWTDRVEPENSTWNSVVWSPELELFVAVAEGGTNQIMTSSNGTNWTAHAEPESNAWTSIAWSPELNLFVAVAEDGTNQIMTSSNGTNWTVHASPESNIWTSIVWSPELELFVAVAESGTNRVMISSDGLNWTGASAITDNYWKSIVWSPELELFVVVGAGGTGASRVMTGATITAITNVTTNITNTTATLQGFYLDDFPGADVYFRYRKTGSADQYNETSPQTMTSEGNFTASITGLDPGTSYEVKSIVEWSTAAGTQELESGLVNFVTEAIPFAAHVVLTSSSATSQGVDEDLPSVVFNISVNNTNGGLMLIANITDVNITIPVSFSFNATNITNGTTALATLKIDATRTILSWRNVTGIGGGGLSTEVMEAPH